MSSAELGKQLGPAYNILWRPGAMAPKARRRAKGSARFKTGKAALDASIARGLAEVEAGRSAPTDEGFKRRQDKYRGISENSRFETLLSIKSISYSL